MPVAQNLHPGIQALMSVTQGPVNDSYGSGVANASLRFTPLTLESSSEI